MNTYRQRPRRARTALVSAGAAIASCAALATVGSGVAMAATHSPRTKTKQTKQTKMKHRTAKVTSVPWGTINYGPSAGQTANLYTLHGAGGMKVNVDSFGADLQSIDVADNKGKMTDVILGFPNLYDYVEDFTQGAQQIDWPIPGSTSGSGDTYFGATIGQYANRIANGSFPLNGTTYTLDTNNGPNTLHGGYFGWNTYNWTGTPSATKNKASLTMSYDFPANMGCDKTITKSCTGFPTAINASVTFTVTKNNSLQISYSAQNASPSLSTVVNLTNHAYYNLGGQASGTIYGQDLAINSNTYQPTNGSQIPEAPYFLPVKGTPFDFTHGHSIGKYIQSANRPDGTQSTSSITQLQYAHGYDFNWVLNDQGKYREDAVAEDPDNGITLAQYTDQPGVQVYTANYLQGDLRGTTGSVYRQGTAFTLETQHYPDAPNHQGDPAWPTVVLGPGQTFTTRTTDVFSVQKPNFVKQVSFK